MGTNYYTIPKADDSLKEKIKVAIDAEDWAKAQSLIPKQIHIGLSAIGWKFLFNHNDWEHFGKNLDSLCDFLKANVIEDEYGVEITFEDFWKLVRAKETGIDGKEYYSKWKKYNQVLPGGKAEPFAFIPKNYGEEYHFGLRFSDTTNFS